MDSTATFEQQLQALGRIIDRRERLARDLCILQAGDGFVVHLVRPTAALSGPAFAPATITIEASEFRAALREVVEPAAAPAKPNTGGLRWFTRE
jgi:hypothetical protein